MTRSLRGNDHAMPWPVILLMSVITLLAIISELLPAGLLREMGESLSADYSMVGQFVGAYALTAALGAIPVTRLVTKVNRRPLLIAVVLGFGLGNLLTAISPYFWLVMGARLIGGVCAGLMWSMLAAYTLQMVPAAHAGRAVTLVFSGSTIGLSLGVPLMTYIGQAMHWRLAFGLVALGFFIVAAFGYKLLPSVPGQSSGHLISPKDMVKNRNVMMVVVLTFLFVCAHYTSYVYIQMIAERLGMGLQAMQIVFGLGAICAVVAVARLIDDHLKSIMLTVFIIGIIAMAIFVWGASSLWLGFIGMFLWGLSFGPISTLMQTATTRQTSEGQDIAISLQTTSFDLSIMIASGVGAFLLKSFGLSATLLFAIFMFVMGLALVVTHPKNFE
ncbi:MFS transporter [Aerococcus sp. UMB8487]|uniref:MFS transporter n=1 Tax=Aerococcus sp. UMB8487 TaxID=3046346 RepID=UPI002549D3E5|nr:MFS transporter [Aerococcus sp. UMB8487]MDK6940681.1 MFS transporter [Aerococcus sp. UMB8487]